MSNAVSMTFRQLIERRAVDHSEDIFCFFQDEKITFGELRDQIDRYVYALIHAGVRQGDRVALMLPNCPEHIYLFFALAWIGAVAVPVSIHLKRSGLVTQLSSARPRMVIADASYLEMADALADLPAIDTVIWRGEITTTAQQQGLRFATLMTAASPVQVGVAPGELDRPCAISYTSGTTGEPKGAVLNERWFQIGAKNAGILAGVRPGDVLFMWEPFFHVAGWMTVLICLQHKVAMAMVERFSASQCWDQMRHYGATHFHYLGGAMNLLLKQPARPNDRDNPVRVAWGAAAPTQSWREFERRFGVEVREGYGITEAGNFTMLNTTGEVGSIGTPVEEFDAWIENDQGIRVQTGEVGEIVLQPRMPGVTMIEYFGQPERSAEVLRDGRVYSGDLGYQDSAGRFFFAGRKKDALRRRGENVSAWEVERVVNEHPAVEESAVIGVPSELGEQDIKVFIRTAPGMSVQPLEIIRWCEKSLAYYQIPRYIEFVSDFPRGPTQRIKKNDLPMAHDKSWDFEQSGEASHAHRVKR